MSVKRAFHCHTRPSPANKSGFQVIYFGARIGWYPCLKGPFIQLAFFKKRFEVWYGLPSYQHAEVASE